MSTAVQRCAERMLTPPEQCGCATSSHATVGTNQCRIIGEATAPSSWTLGQVMAQVRDSMIFSVGPGVIQDEPKIDGVHRVQEGAETLRAEQDTVAKNACILLTDDLKRMGCTMFDPRLLGALCALATQLTPSQEHDTEAGGPGGRLAAQLGATIGLIGMASALTIIALVGAIRVLLLSFLAQRRGGRVLRHLLSSYRRNEKLARPIDGRDLC
eukprot:3605786-Amphidinium_carterae.1